MNRALSQVDPEIARAMEQELDRQQNCLVMIPSENYASKAVLQAQGCIMTNKYAEGYPGARWYNGCEQVDTAENLAIERAKELFGADHVNVQPHTGSQANMAAYYALLQPGDRVLSLPLDHGGHLTHGQNSNFSGRYYRFTHYGVDRETEVIDLDVVRRLAHREKPKLISVGYSAYPRAIDFAEWRKIADEVDAYLMADVAHIVGLIAAKEHPDPVPYCDIITSTTHKTLRGPRGAFIMCRREYADAVDRACFPGVQAGPLMHVIAAKAVAFKEAMTDSFRAYQHQIVLNAKALAKALMERGFRLVSGGTDTHLMLVDLRPLNMFGATAADLLEEAGILVNKNSIPFDHVSSALASGIRPGSPAVTTRGMKEPEMEQIAEMMSRVLHDPESESVRKEVLQEVRELCARFPIYEDLTEGHCG
ncbi:MAG: serine hydroxymethyltransferase [Armatimonadetes bacterium]|nr:serine hydroxymethyltransferase [Armatimonadota bacterium]NIM24243.1 serine hydroxymethyltransferase [Armatimonadota bacterium]NIM68112.1 serine hydroxymethyltransferase [Armatimonadota bacterium]NIM76574.1 serine hydroxymethyltransferase [Armatimonadota bacterium]NIN06317.1 serine hydroxymethyltransferase [Armatimonadota bacterium]